MKNNNITKAFLLRFIKNNLHLSRKEIANELNISFNNLVYLLSKYKIRFFDIKRKEMIRLYREGYDLEFIANVFGMRNKSNASRSVKASFKYFGLEKEYEKVKKRKPLKIDTKEKMIKLIEDCGFKISCINYKMTTYTLNMMLKKYDLYNWFYEKNKELYGNRVGVKKNSCKECFNKHIKDYRLIISRRITKVSEMIAYKCSCDARYVRYLIKRYIENQHNEGQE